MKEKTSWIILIIVFILIVVSAFAITNNYFNINPQTNEVSTSADSNSVSDSSNYHVENSSNVTVISNNIEWYTDLDSALSVAQKDQKPLFLAFQSSTCQYCQQMNSETYTDVNVQDKLNSYYIPVIIDGDNHPELCSKYQVVSYPTFVILNSNGNVNKTIIGFQSVNDLLSKI